MATVTIDIPDDLKARCDQIGWPGMNRYVLDASVIVKWLIPESPTEHDVEQALALFAELRDNTISVQPPMQ